MNAAEALTRLIELGDHNVQVDGENIELMDEEALKDHEDNKVAVAICQAMLNMMLPVAKYRLHVEVEAVSSKKAPGKPRLEVAEFTACGISVKSLRNSVAALFMADSDVRVTLWEQRADGADMLMGYQGPTKSSRFRKFFEQMDQIREVVPN